MNMWFQFVLVLMLASSSMNTVNAVPSSACGVVYDSGKTPGSNPQQDFLAKLLPGLANGMAGGGTNGGSLPALSSITQALPALRDIPELGFLQKGGFGGSHKPFDRALKDFTGPMLKLATDEEAGLEEVHQMLKSIPDLVVNIPGFGEVDVSKIPKGNLTQLFSPKVMQMLKLLPPGYDLNKLSPEVMKSVLAGKMPDFFSLPPDLQQHLKENMTTLFDDADDSLPKINLTQVFSQKALQMMKLLPPGYDMNKLSPEVMESVMAGKIPDFFSLPTDLQQYLKENMNSLFEIYTDEPDMSLDDMLDELPVFELPVGPTFAPYDINKVEPDLVSKKQDGGLSSGIITAIALGVVGTATAVVIGLFCYNIKNSTSATLAAAMNV